CPAAYPHVELAVVADATVPGDDGVTVRLTAIKRLRLTWVDDVVRTVPRISALLIDDVPVAPGTSPVAVDAGDEVVVAVRPAPDALDRTCDGAQPPARVLEPVRIHLYATAGDLGAASVDARHDAADVEQLDTTTYVAPMAGAAVLWAVAVDDDGGIGWARFDVAVR
ncbi:MAG: hypothetical protein KC464_11865, partial [Myxococcales bacterium]|nr:hypothetical protein [Myxococcales bacterium]